MSAPVRVEAKALGDPRIEYLGKLAGYSRHEALGRLVHLWGYCTERLAYILTASEVEPIIGAPAELLVRAGLAELVPDGVRIKGTQGRIEWLAQKQNAGKASAAKRALNGYPTDVERALNETSTHVQPLTLPLTLPLSPDLPSGDIPNKKPKRAKPKPGDPTEAELASVSVVLSKLSERTGIAYRGSVAHTRLIVARLRDGASEMDLRKVIGYCAEKMGWQNDPAWGKYLRPETLFGPATIERYLDAARAYYPEEPQLASPVVSTLQDAPELPAFVEPEWMR